MTPTPMDFLTKLANQLDDKKVVSVKLPTKFSNLNQSEVFEIELALTKFLLSQHDLRNEFINYLTNIPTFFPNAPKNELILFVADFSVPDAPFHMLTVKERNEVNRSKISKSLLLFFPEIDPRRHHATSETSVNSCSHGECLCSNQCSTLATDD